MEDDFYELTKEEWRDVTRHCWPADWTDADFDEVWEMFQMLKQQKALMAMSECKQSLNEQDHIGPIICEPVSGLKHWFCWKCKGSVTQPADGKARLARGLP